MVQQDPVIMAASFRDNITLGRDIDDERIRRVLDMVQLSEHISQLEHGLDTELGEQGNTLSDGQKQLLAMARVLVQTPKILIWMKQPPILTPVLNRPFRKLCN